MKKYIVEFTEANGEVYEFEFNTRDIILTIEQYCRNREITAHRILNEDLGTKKQMLFG